MMTAALIPMLFIVGLVGLFVAGAGSISGFPVLAVMALLIGLEIGLGRMLACRDERSGAY